MPNASAGWDDCPPPHDPTSEPVERSGDYLVLTGKSLVAQRARPVFDAILASRLKESEGNGQYDDMVGALGFFHLRLTENEVQMLLDSARRQSEPVIRTPHSKLSEPVAGDIELTDAAMKKRFPVHRWSETGVLASVLIWRVFDKGQAVLLALVGLILGLGAAAVVASIDKYRGWCILAVSLTWLGLVLGISTRTELQRKAVAEAWPRLRAYRPHIWEWETHRWRHWLFPVGQWVIAAFAGAAIVAGQPAAYALGGVALVGALALVGVYLTKIRPVKRDRDDEIKSVERCRVAKGWYG